MVTGPSVIRGADTLRRTRVAYQCEFSAVIGREAGLFLLLGVGSAFEQRDWCIELSPDV